MMKYKYVVKVQHIEVPFVNWSVVETLCNISVLLSCTSSTSSVDITAKYYFSVLHTPLDKFVSICAFTEKHPFSSVLNFYWCMNDWTL